MNEVQELVDRIVDESGRKDKAFAAGVESAALWKIMQEGRDVISEPDGMMMHLRTVNREVYLSFSEANNYRFVLMKEATPEYDRWRFTKKT